MVFSHRGGVGIESRSSWVGVLEEGRGRGVGAARRLKRMPGVRGVGVEGWIIGYGTVGGVV
eukprot:767530-Hanusia_phi.AAC.10